MKQWLAAVIFVFTMLSSTLEAAKGPEINLTDNKLSVSAEAISIGRLLRLLDLATGMKSKVPPELANRNVSVKFSGLNLPDGVRKIFQGQPLDYVLIEGQGVVVTAVSQTASGGPEPAPANNPPPQQFDQPFVQDFPPPPPPGLPGQQFGQPPQQQQPAMIQTPFGPIANPRAGQPAQQPNAPLSTPGQQNSLFPANAIPAQPNGQPQQVSPPFPGSQPSTPFGTQSPFGTPNPAPANPNGLFGAPSVFGGPGGQQRTP